MRPATDMGKNLTGAGMAPFLSERMEENLLETEPTSPGDEQAAAEVRQEYSEEASPVGTTPPPANAKGIAKAGLEMLKGHKPTVFLNKLGERLAFERTGTRLYQTLIAKYDSLGSWEGGPTREELAHFCDEERQHFEMVRAAIEELGGDPTAMTPAADLAGVASEGVLKVISDPRAGMAESLNALLIAELTDNDGWVMLIELADRIGQDKFAKHFETALEQEQEHLETVRRWLTTQTELDATRET